MNLVYGDVVKILTEIRVAGALKKVPLELLTDAEPGDTILVCNDVGISRVTAANMEIKNVPRNPG